MSHKITAPSVKYVDSEHLRELAKGTTDSMNVYSMSEKNFNAKHLWRKDPTKW